MRINRNKTRKCFLQHDLTSKSKYPGIIGINLRLFNSMFVYTRNFDPTYEAMPHCSICANGKTKR